MTYTVEIYRSAQKQLGKINTADRNKIYNAIRALAEDPGPENCKKLKGRPAYRIRIGDYRVIYEIHDQELIVIIITVGHRREIYR